MVLFYEDRSGARAWAARSLADLPEEVLLLVMEHVPLIARLGSCSLVCLSLHKAAAAVTCSIKVPSCRPTAAALAQRSALQLYLQKYGHQLTSISLNKADLCFQDQSLHGTAEDDRQQQRLLTLLPCSHLQELVLSGGRLQPAVLHAPAATLTKLILQSSVQLVKSPTARRFIKRRHGWDKAPGVLLEDEWSDGSESDAESDAADYPSESDDDGPPNSLQASTAPLGRQFHRALQHLRGLKHLQLEYCSDGTQATRFGKALPVLTHLTHLKVLWYCVNFKPWRQHLSCLTDLRVLALCTDRGQSQGFVQDLDQHSLLADEVLEGVQHLQRLTELRVEGLCLAVTAHSSSTLGRLTGLQVLQLCYASCDLSALAAITGLRSLSLQHITPSLKDGPDHFWRPEPQPVSKQQLQAALLQLQHLTFFEIQVQQWHWDSPCTLKAVDDTWELPGVPWSHYYLPTGRDAEDKACGDAEHSIVGINGAKSGASFEPQPGMEVFAAFTASSCLQHLDLSNAVLQFHTWQHMFPAGRTLLQLTCLQAPHALCFPDQFGDPADSDLALTDADVEAMVSCCPALQALDAANVLHLSDKPHLSTLQHLTRLEAMWGGDYYRIWDSSGDGDYMDIWGRVDKAAAARELSKLANLRQLKLRGQGQWGECLFKALQQLNHLTSLCLTGMYMTRGRLADGDASLIARLTGLQELDVQDCWLQETQLLQLASLPQLARLCFTPAADMSTVFAQAVESFKGSGGQSDMRQIPDRVCVIESKVSLVC